MFSLPSAAARMSDQDVLRFLYLVSLKQRFFRGLYKRLIAPNLIFYEGAYGSKTRML